MLVTCFGYTGYRNAKFGQIQVHERITETSRELLMQIKELAIHRRVSRLNYSRRCAEASAVQAHMKQGIPLAPGMEIGYVIRDARKWKVDPERTASKFDATYYRGLLEKTWGEAAFVFTWQKPKIRKSISPLPLILHVE